MYDFHKKRSNQNEHVFQHKKFLKNQKELIKTIKRKNKKDFQANDNNEQALIEYCNNDLITKKATKNNLEKLLTCLIKSVKDNNEKQAELELKIKDLGQQNENILLQNQKMLQEIVSKT